MQNDRNNFWRNVAAGVGIAAAGGVIAYLIKEAFDSTEEQPRSERSGNCHPSPPNRRRRRASSTFANGEDFSAELARRLKNETYQCPICLEETKQSQITACKHCHIIFHLTCLRTHVSTSRGEGNPPVCPLCREKISHNLEYTCFCGKKTNPVPMEGLTPHSCGGICFKNHSCYLVCHPGPCD